SFVATLQFVPGLIGALFWPGANRNGLFCGLVAGFVVWALALLLPMLFPSWQPTALFDLLDISRRSPAAQWHHVAMASVIANSVVFALVSLFSRTSSAERSAADACAVDSLRRPFRWELEVDSVDDFIRSLTEPLGPVTAARE